MRVLGFLAALVLAFVTGSPAHAYQLLGAPPSVSSGGVPTEAAAAGLTTLAGNFDFSQALYATPSNWLSCPGTSPTGSVVWRFGGPGYTPSSGLCIVNQVVDPTYGQTVMDAAWSSSYNPSGCTQGTLDCGFSAQTAPNAPCSGPPNPSNCFDFPQNYYMEIVYRASNLVSVPNGDASYAGANEGVWTWGKRTDTTNTDPTEIDLPESYVTSPTPTVTVNMGNHGSSDAGCSTSCWINKPSNFDFTQYHKYQVLQTTDGASKQYDCFWVDDVFSRCSDANATSVQYAIRNWLVMSAGPGKTPSLGSWHMYTQYIRVYSCANWNSASSPANQCNGTTLFNNGSLTYWRQ